jgi:L-alanine-DL-glutamate epimerase-like enolase superfamily enzyme
MSTWPRKADPEGGDSVSRIRSIEIRQVDLTPPVVRTDAIQSFVKQETPLVRILSDDGAEGTGYAYTIGTGGSSVVVLLRDHFAPFLIGRDPAMVEEIWNAMLFHSHATTVGAITALAMAAIDTALWDLRCRRAGLPLHVMAGGARARIPVYTTEGGWLHIAPEKLIDETLAAKAQGFKGAKIKVGKPSGAEDARRLTDLRAAVGEDFALMVDANQRFSAAEAVRRAALWAPLDLEWFEEPLPADDIDGHARVAAASTTPIAVGESLYCPGHFAEYLKRGACGIVQVDVARIGGITPWLKVAHMAEACNVPVSPHFLMELHVALCCAVPNAQWLEYIPQLDPITNSRLKIENGFAYPHGAPGIGIEWNWKAIKKMTLAGSSAVVK